MPPVSIFSSHPIPLILRNFLKIFYFKFIQKVINYVKNFRNFLFFKRWMLDSNQHNPSRIHPINFSGQSRATIPFCQSIIKDMCLLLETSTFLRSMIILNESMSLSPYVEVYI